jgi:hypothetical protein
MIVLAIDPGPEVSAAVLYDSDASRVMAFKREDNETVRAWMRRELPSAASYKPVSFAIEMVASYGMPVGAEVFDTCVQIGRYIELWSQQDAWCTEARRVYRREVKLHLCGTVRATDATVRHAILDRFGPGRAKAVGTKAAPGPLYGLSADLWQAFAVALVVADGTGAQRAA